MILAFSLCFENLRKNLLFPLVTFWTIAFLLDMLFRWVGKVAEQQWSVILDQRTHLAFAAVYGLLLISLLFYYCVFAADWHTLLKQIT